MTPFYLFLQAFAISSFLTNANQTNTLGVKTNKQYIKTTTSTARYVRCAELSSLNYTCYHFSFVLLAKQLNGSLDHLSRPAKWTPVLPCGTAWSLSPWTCHSAWTHAARHVHSHSSNAIPGTSWCHNS